MYSTSDSSICQPIGPAAFQRVHRKTQSWRLVQLIAIGSGSQNTNGMLQPWTALCAQALLADHHQCTPDWILEPSVGMRCIPLDLFLLSAISVHSTLLLIL